MATWFYSLSDRNNWHLLVDLINESTTKIYHRLSMMSKQQSNQRFLAPSALLLLLLLFPLVCAACEPDKFDCTLKDLTISADQLFQNQLTASTTRLTLVNVNLTSWPPQIPATTGRVAQLQSLTLEQVGGNLRIDGKLFSSLEKLSLVNCCPMAVGGGGRVNALDGIANLTELSISGGCRIDTLNSTWIGRLPALRTLTIDNARVDSLNMGSLSGDTRIALRDLTLKNNRFKKLDDDAFGSMPNLQRLMLDGNIVQFIQPAVFTGLTRLRELNILLPQLRDDELVKIWEHKLDGRFDANNELQILRMVNARLAEEQIPRALERLNNLRQLDLSGHRFRSLSNSILSGLTNLRKLDLSNGTLICLYDRNFGIMKYLEELNLANNEIRVIGQRALLGLASLTSLDLSGNPIQEIERGAFCSLPDDVKASSNLLAGLSRSGIIGAANLSEPCPPGFDPNRLVLSSRPQCLLPKLPNGSGAHNPGDGKSSSSGQSKHTFLIIIGLCVAFLLITVISMMAYKGWSKRKNAQLARDEEKEMEVQAMIAAAGAPAAGPGPDNNDNNKKTKPQNGRHRRHHAAKPSTPAAATTADSAPEAVVKDGEIEIVQAQVESPENTNNPNGDESTSEAASTSPKKAPEAVTATSAEPTTAAKTPQLRPGVTLMTSVPEDSDLEARAITTLVVV